MVTDAEKRAPRKQVLARRRRCGENRRRLPPRKRGSNQRYKEFKAVMVYDHRMEYRRVSVTCGDYDTTGKLIRGDGCRIGGR